MTLQTLLSALRKCERLSVESDYTFSGYVAAVGYNFPVEIDRTENRYARLAQKLEARIVGMFDKAYDEGAQMASFGLVVEQILERIKEK